MKTAVLAKTTGKTLYAFPSNQLLSAWATYRVKLDESSSPNLGLYTAELDESISSLWYSFEGASQPAGFYAADDVFDLSDKYAIISGTVTTTSPVRESGDLEDIIIGDDYLVSTYSFSWEVDALTDVTASEATCKFGGKRNEVGWSETGTITDLGSGRWRVSFLIGRSVFASLAEGYYQFSVQLIGPAPVNRRETRVISKKPVFLKNSYTS